MGRLIFIDAAGGHQHGGHHGQIAVSRSHHIRHHVPVIVLAGPDESALGTNHPGHRIVNQGIEIFNAQLLKLLPEFSVIDFLEDILERMIIFLGYGILGGEPQILPGVYGISEAGSGKAADGLLRVVDALQNPGSLELVNQFPCLGAVLGSEHQFRPAGPGHFDFCILIDVPIGMSGNRDGLRPVLHIGDDALHQDGGPEHSAVQYRTDGAVGALPHLLQVILLHPGPIGGYGGALHGNAVLQCGIGGIHRDLVIGGIPVLQA